MKDQQPSKIVDWQKLNVQTKQAKRFDSSRPQKRQFDTQFAEDQRQFGIRDQNEKTKIANEQQHRQFMEQQSKRINDMNIATQKLEIAMTQATGQERQRLARELLQKRQELAEIEKQTGIANTLQGRTVSEIKMMESKFTDALAKMANADQLIDQTSTDVMSTVDSEINRSINNPLERDQGAALLNIIGVAIGEPLLGDEPSTFLGLTLDGNIGDALFNQGPFENLDEKISNVDPNSTTVQVEAGKTVITPVVRGLVQSLGLQGKESDITSAIEGAFRTAAGMGAPGQDPRFEENAKGNLDAYFNQLENLGVSRGQLSSIFEQLQIKMNEQSSNILDSINEGTAVFGMDFGDAGAKELSRFWGGAMQGVGDNLGLLVGQLRGTFQSAETLAPLMDSFNEVLGGTRRGGDMEVLQQFFGGEDFATLEDQFGDLDQDALMRLIEQEQAGLANIEDLVSQKGDAAFAVETARSDPGRDLTVDPELKALYEGVMGQ